ncbi:MAG TPA: hypothetical protein VI072_11020 [Polyangiaceae bacterium]
MKKLYAAAATLVISAPMFFACNGSSDANEQEQAIGNYLPCNVETVLKAKCQSCHAATPLYGAPLPLMTYDDTQVPYKGLSAWRSMKDAVESETMPQGTKLDAAEKKTLMDWFALGALGAEKSCSGASGGAGGNGAGGSSGKGGSGGAAGSAGKGGAGGAAGSGGKGGAGGSGGQESCMDEKCLGCEITHRMTARNSLANDKFPVPKPTRDRYVCFTFKSPFAAGELATAMGNITDDARVLHHWILFGVTPDPKAPPPVDGTYFSDFPCQLVTGTGTHITGWAPGGNSTILPDDVGLELNYPFFQLQVHYYNTEYDNAADASGVAFCTTKSPRTNIAGIVTLGTTNISIPRGATAATATGECSNLSNDGTTPLTVIGASPHMHLLGTGFRTEHLRGAANQGDLSNIPNGSWSFEQQRHYSINRRQVMPNDLLRTTCTYRNPGTSAVGFGPRTSDEMCYDFITVYPYAKSKKKCGPAI